MAMWEWLRELPFVDDVADALDIFAEFIPDAEVGAVSVGDYTELREGMFWTVGADGLDTRDHMLTDLSLEPVVYDEQGNVSSGLWRDPHTGFESSESVGLRCRPPRSLPGGGRGVPAAVRVAEG